MTSLAGAAFLLLLAFTGLANASDETAIDYDPAAMEAARLALKDSHGDQVHSLILGERFEYRSNEGDPLVLWEGQGWLGGDVRKLWIKTEGEYDLDAGRFEEAEFQGLYSHAVSAFWDVQVGLRHDVRPDPTRTYAVVGIQGLAPYWFELDGALFLSEKGDVSARVEVEYDLRLTQRLILQPRLELNAAFSDDADAAVGTGTGLSTASAGLRLRYEVMREFAPYVGVSWNRAFGTTRKFADVASRDSDQFSWVAGVRFWL